MAEVGFTVQEFVDAALQRIRAATGTSSNFWDVGLDALNRALAEFSMAQKWRFLRRTTSKSTVASTRSVSLDEDCLAVNGIYVNVSGNDRELDLIEEDKARQLYPNDSTTEGGPEAYISGVYDVSDDTKPPIKTIDILPTPDKVYTLSISYQASIPKYETADIAKIPVIPQFAMSAVQELTYAKLLAFVKNPRTEVNQALQNYLVLLESVKRFDRDFNKGQRDFRLRSEVVNYRNSRYQS